jgi:hypothetical protein
VHFSLVDSEGVPGKLLDILFDWRKWVVRYLLVSFDEQGQDKLVSPIGIRGVDWSGGVYLAVSREQVAASPGLGEDGIVSRRTEISINRHFSWLCYWSGNGRWGNADNPQSLRLDGDSNPEEIAVACGEDDGASDHIIGLQQLKRCALQVDAVDLWVVKDALIEERTYCVPSILVSNKAGLSNLIESKTVRSVDSGAGIIALSRPGVAGR